MANNRNGNMIWVDTASVGYSKDKHIYGIIVHCTHGTTAARITLANNNAATSYPVCFDIEVPAAEDSKHFDFSTFPLTFSDGVYITTITNATMTLIVGGDKGV